LHREGPRIFCASTAMSALRHHFIDSPALLTLIFEYLAFKNRTFENTASRNPSLQYRLCVHLNLLLAIGFTSVIYPLSASAASWWDCEWFYRSEINVSATGTATNFAVPIELQGADFHSAYAFSSNGFDLRVIDSDDTTELDFFLDEWNVAESKAVLSVNLPQLTQIPRTLFVYYGNSPGTLTGQLPPVPTASNAQSTFVESGWRLHTRPSSANPSSEAEARVLFNNIDDSANGYGCAIIDSIEGRNNRNTFSGPRVDYGLLAETYFEVDIPGIWSFRLGADYGRGGGLFVDGQGIDERWNEDIWWALNFNNPDVLTGSIHLENGYHHIEALGYEGCCDGTINMQYKTPGSVLWLDMDSTNIPLLGRSCPPGILNESTVATDTPAFFGGSVFYDNGSGGVAHDGVRDSAETGAALVDVTVNVLATGSSLTDQTNANGNWSVCFLDEAAGSDIDISASIPSTTRFVSESTSAINSNPAINGIIAFTAVAATDYTDNKFGLIEAPELNADRVQPLAANSSASISHTYTATTTSEVSFQISPVQHSPPQAFSYTVLRDNNCDGVVDQPPVVLSNPVSVVAGQALCITIEVTSGSDVDANSTLTLRVDANTRIEDLNLEFLNTNIDEVSGLSMGELIIEKLVCNTSDLTCNVLAGDDFGTYNKGLPGEKLRYKITFSTTDAAVSEVTLSDSVPFFTTLEPLSILMQRTPDGVDCRLISPVDQSLSNYKGSIEWSCDGVINPLDFGVFSFTVEVD